MTFKTRMDLYLLIATCLTAYVLYLETSVFTAFGAGITVGISYCSLLTEYFKNE